MFTNTETKNNKQKAIKNGYYCLVAYVWKASHMRYTYTGILHISTSKQKPKKSRQKKEKKGNDESVGV